MADPATCVSARLPSRKGSDTSVEKGAIQVLHDLRWFEQLMETREITQPEEEKA